MITKKTASVKEYKLPILNGYYRDKLDLLIADDGRGDYFSEAQLRHFRPTYNRLRKNPIWQRIAERGNNWELRELAGHITKGEVIANADTLLWYLIDRYAERDQRTLAQAAGNDDFIRRNFDELTCWLRGLSIRYPDLISFCATHGQTCLTFKCIQQ
ncbi:hypothetical protein FACS1894208_00580 [Clostridia bacterium]|nr:hypothetical protein FACS1894208_00580 [Clostridia bacterium]